MSEPQQHNNNSSSHPWYLAHHFKSMPQQTSAGKLGMWIFMAQELLFFSGLFCAYGYVRVMYPEMFLQAQTTMDWRIGTFNTIVLLVSSLTMSLCVRSARLNNRAGSIKYLIATMLLGVTFLLVKATEWGHHFQEGYYPGKFFNPIESAEVKHPLAHIFFGLYYVITGTHGIHIIIGLGLMVWMLIRASRGEFNSENYVSLENTSLFWHLVDVVWIFLFPLIYLAK